MTELTDALRHCTQAKATLADMARLLTSLITVLEERQPEKAVMAGTIDRCQHNLMLVEASIEIVTALLQQTDNVPNVLQKLHKTIADLRDTGKWQPGEFFQALKQRLHILEHGWQPDMSPINSITPPLTNATQVEPVSTTNEITQTICVFIHLYQATGKSLAAWLPQLHNLHHLMQSRPVYTNQADVMAALQARGHLSTDAYVALVLPEKALAPNFRGKIQTDKYGHELSRIDIDLCPRQLVIDYFYHRHQQYHLVDGELVTVPSKST